MAAAIVTRRSANKHSESVTNREYVCVGWQEDSDTVKEKAINLVGRIQKAQFPPRKSMIYRIFYKYLKSLLIIAFTSLPSCVHILFSRL